MTGAPLRILVVDDEPIARRRLSILCAEIGGVDIVGEAADGVDAIEQARRLSPDLILLDISMPELDGMAVATRSTSLGHLPAIVFCTASSGQAAQAFDIPAIDYLLKPISRDRLERALGRVRAHRAVVSTPAPSTWLDHLWVPHQGGIHRIEVAEIHRIDADGDFVRLWTGRAGHMLHETLSRLESRLDPTAFVRLRRSCIVRIASVIGLRHVGFGAWEAELDSGDRVRIGPTYWKSIKVRLRHIRPSTT